MAFESLFFQNLLALNDYYNFGYKLFYYRTRTGIEVDFIVYGGKRKMKEQNIEIIPIEDALKNLPQILA